MGSPGASFSKTAEMSPFLFFFTCFGLLAEALGTGSSSWHSEDGGPNSRRGGETPSSCATPTSASFPSEPEVDADVGGNHDGNNPTAPYPCQFCDRTFPRLSYLKKHEQVRTRSTTSFPTTGYLRPLISVAEDTCTMCGDILRYSYSRDKICTHADKDSYLV